MRPLLAAGVALGLVVTGLVATVTADPTPTGPAGRVLWDGGFETGGIPEGSGGASCTFDDSGASEAYASLQTEGNDACRDDVALTRERTRTADSERSLRVEMAAGQQREQLQSSYQWTPDADGSVDLWYGWSMYYDVDWLGDDEELDEVSATDWHNPVAWRMEGDNGSLNLSGDLSLDNADGRPFARFATPHLVLRRNTVQNERGVYDDGRGLDKIDLGAIEVGHWMDLVCHVRWSTTSTNALRECWRDGRFQGGSRTRNAIAEDEHTFRVGQYQTTGITRDRTTYIDNVRIGTSYRAVDPARGDR